VRIASNSTPIVAFYEATVLNSCLTVESEWLTCSCAG
jgi:hypothetical protein